MTETTSDFVDGETTPEATDNTIVSVEAVHDGSQEKEPTPEKIQSDLEHKLAEQSFQTRRERREREAAQAEVARMQAEQSQSSGTRPDVPEMPDQYDDNFTERMAAREAAVREVERFDVNADNYQRQQENAYYAQQAQEQQRMQKVGQDFQDTALKLGIPKDEVRHNGQRVVDSGVLSSHEMDMILGDEQGPLITKYLSENPVALNHLSQLPPGSSERMTHLLVDIKQKASALKAKTTSTPEPISTVSGSGGSSGNKYPGTEGMTFM